jgi:zinc protease
MPNRFATLLLFSLTGLAAAAAPPAPSKSTVFPYPIHVDTLPNGLTVARVPFPSTGLVAFYTVVRVGSRNEIEPGHSGFAHFFEHVMFKGTPRYPTGKREALLGKLGFNDNAFTSDDVTVYHSYGPSASLDLLIDIESDRFQNLAYPEATFQTEAKAVLGEYHKNAAFPDLKIEEKLHATAFTKHPYQHTTLGFYDDIKAMPDKYKYSLEFFKRWYRPENVSLFIVGDFDDAKVMEQVRSHYGAWKSAPIQVDIPAEPPQRSTRSVHIDWPSATLPRHVLAWHTPASTTRTNSTAVQTVLGAYLTGPTSPLFKDLVLKRQLAESISADTTPHRDPSLFVIDVKLKEERNRAEVKKALDKAIKELVSGKVDAKRLADIKSHMVYSAPMEMETADDVAEQLAWYAGIMGDTDALLKTYDEIAKVTPAQIVEFVKKYFPVANRTTLTLTSKPGAEASR